MIDEGKMQEMYLLEQNYQNLILQKQSFQMELAETESALREIENSGEGVYKVIGQLMLKTDKEKMKKELSEKKEILLMRVKSLEKQENSMAEKLEVLRKEIQK